MRNNPGRGALTYGVLASALAHLLLVAVNPGFRTTSPRSPAERLVAIPKPIVSLRIEQGTPPAARATPVSVPGDAFTADTLRVPGGPRTPRVAGAEHALPGSLERLRAPRDPQIWSPPAAEPESLEQRKLRELHARLEAGAKAPFTYQERLALERAGAVKPCPGFCIPAGPKPPPPAQVLPAPPALAVVALDSVSRRGEQVYAHFGAFAISFPPQLRRGDTFSLTAHFRAGSDSARVHVFVNGKSRAHADGRGGVARVSLRIDEPGEHVLLVHFIDTAEGAAQIRHTIRLES